MKDSKISLGNLSDASMPNVRIRGCSSIIKEVENEVNHKCQRSK